MDRSRSLPQLLLRALGLLLAVLACAAVANSALADPDVGTTTGGPLVNDHPPQLPGAYCQPTGSVASPIKGSAWSFKTVNNAGKVQTVSGSEWYASYWSPTSAVRGNPCQKITDLSLKLPAGLAAGNILTKSLTVSVVPQGIQTFVHCARVQTVRSATSNSPLIQCTGNMPGVGNSAVMSFCPAIDHTSDARDRVYAIHCTPSSLALVPGKACGTENATPWDYDKGKKVYSSGVAYDVQALRISGTVTPCAIADTTTFATAREMLTHPTGVVTDNKLPFDYSSIRCQIDATAGGNGNTYASDVRVNECDTVGPNGSEVRVFFWLAIDHPKTGSATGVIADLPSGAAGPGFGATTPPPTTTTTTPPPTTPPPTTPPSDQLTVSITGGCPTNTASNPLPYGTDITLSGTITPDPDDQPVLVYNGPPANGQSEGVFHPAADGTWSAQVNTSPPSGSGPGPVAETLYATTVNANTTSCPTFYVATS